MVDNRELLVQIRPSESIPIGFWILGTQKLLLASSSISKTVPNEPQDQTEDHSVTTTTDGMATLVETEPVEDQPEQPHAHRRPFIEVSGSLDHDGTFFLFSIIIFLNRYNPKGIDYTIHVAPYLKVNQTDYVAGRYSALPQIVSEN
jgi:hypothetical protein